MDYMLPEVVIQIFVFMFAVTIGSFLNVCIYRIPEKQSIVFPPSACPECKTPIRWFDNIPIISYLILAGKCRVCKTRISIKYLLIEALTGLLALAIYFVYGLSPDFLIYFSFTCVLIVISFIDLKYQIIPDKISLPAIPLGFAASFVLADITYVDSLIGIAAGGGVLIAVTVGFLLITGKEGMGGGDVKLLAMIGAFLGWKSVVYVLIVSSFVGAVIGVIYLSMAGKEKSDPIPFGPFLALGALSYLFFGQWVIDLYMGTLWTE
ncbi:MAG: prepilin peptidase [Thermodesulfobacteriota bacterium]